jgi:hypothetical protein
LAGCLFFSSRIKAAFLVATVITLGWRIISEILRADYRGEGKISAYQLMGMGGLLYACGAAWVIKGEAQVRPQLLVGLESFWSPDLLLFLQAIWLTIFLYTGRSTVTGATLSFHVRESRI